MEVRFGAKVKNKRQDAVLELLSVTLLPGERVALVVKTNKVRGLLEFLAFTQWRMLSLGRNPLDVVHEIDNVDVVSAFFQNQAFSGNSVHISTRDGALDLGALLEVSDKGEVRSLLDAALACSDPQPLAAARAQALGGGGYTAPYGTPEPPEAPHVSDRVPPPLTTPTALELAELGALHAGGILTDEEFAMAKAAVISRIAG
ncbi:SHOCT domain-containing protein [Serinibacter arcticus]|uniref:SHOCT domain-containing protein n=1 Tax=Serinibacter arcticus TaxID=1655435 RepID=UPI0018EE7D49|nr:SHOCT domain-containing protein [Serinibacter arcticus]